MGRGNVYCSGKYEGLYYIDNDDIYVYCRDSLLDGSDPETRLLKDLSYDELTGGEWHLDEEGTAIQQEDIIESFTEDFCARFPRFKHPLREQWLNEVRVILESGLFYIGLEDNEWSIAVKLLQKEESQGLPWMENLQKRLYQKYLDGMKDVLLGLSLSIRIRVNAWTSGIITK